LKEFLARVEARRAEEARRDAAERCDLPQPGVGELIGIEDFAKIDMRVGKILAAERVEGSDKLVKLQVDIGSGVRQVVAGIGRAYSPESLPGRLIVVVANLKPAKLMGLTSDGMIVAASEGGNPVLVTFTEPVVVGSRLK
jgi:methionine--tRNA ligase beta chain